MQLYKLGLSMSHSFASGTDIEILNVFSPGFNSAKRLFSTSSTFAEMFLFTGSAEEF